VRSYFIVTDMATRNDAVVPTLQRLLCGSRVQSFCHLIKQVVKHEELISRCRSKLVGTNGTGETHYVPNISFKNFAEYPMPCVYSL
jgi:hypothetical protein